MRILITGHLGYIGSVVSGVLANAHHETFGLDCDLFAGCDFGQVRASVEGFQCDVRDIETADLLPFDAVVHLAGLPEDPYGSIDAGLLEEVNAAGTVRLAQCCKEAGVAKFLFASTCGVYGRRGSEWLTEESAPRPISRYGRSKLLAETALGRLQAPQFRVTALRLGTVYGISPRLRLDTVVNDFVGAAVTGGRLVMKTQGWAWRPLIHIQDVARLILEILHSEDTATAGVLNAACPSDNHRIIDVADLVAENVPHCARFAATGAEDQLSYRVAGDRLAAALPQFRWRYCLLDGIRQLRAAYENAGLTHGDWRSDRYRRAMRLAGLAERGELSLTPTVQISAA